MEGVYYPIYEKYVVQLKDAARIIFNNAEGFVGSAPDIINLEITIKISPEGRPTIYSNQIHVVPELINKKKDLTDPYWEKKKDFDVLTCEKCKHNNADDHAEYCSKCFEHSKWENKTEEED